LQNRTAKEYTLVAIAAIGALSIAPFAYIRFSNNEWFIGIVDLIMSFGMVAICLYVLKTQQTKVPGFVLAVLASVGVLISIAIKGVSQIYWLYPVMISLYYLLPSRWAMPMNATSLLLLIAILSSEMKPMDLSAILLTILISNLFAYIFSYNVEKQHLQLSKLATKDSLTSTGNRGALDAKLAELIAIQQRTPSTVSLILFDLDHFKKINDQYGHIIGDNILIKTAKIIQARIRSTDSVYRYGGEEFVIAPIPIGLTSAAELAEQIRTLINQYRFEENITLTISFGVAEYQTGESYESWLSRADKALYSAKEAGRNKVCLAE